YLDTPGVVLRTPNQHDSSIGPTTAPDFQNPIYAKQHFPRVSITGGSMTFPVPSWYSVVRGELAFINGEPMNRTGQGNPADSAVQPGQPGYQAAVNRLKAQDNITGGLDPFLFPRFTDLSRTTPIRGFTLRKDTWNT